ncbi:hypothetical protein LC608_33985 [Nostoc sp. XA010]|uniref:hypothetical protein n=1 Tax=Nostoc sp. XA010 TaxID=2780407 RepID=UPI001E3E949B|nr:hypothetical protein [Nostoc sp. XA010]MCC5661867.1 hypothetical protein [Nostoc sp. XA010]
MANRACIWSWLWNPYPQVATGHCGENGSVATVGDRSMLNAMPNTQCPIFDA